MAVTEARQRSAHQSLLRHAGFRYLKWALGLTGVAIIVYASYRPPYGSAGDTWAGYGLGGTAGGLMIWLAWLGVRKRRFNSTSGTLRGWTSAHVYLGLALLPIATLHTGFQFGWNVHTLLYVLMSLVVVSGIYGLIAYLVLPARVTANRASASPETLLAEIDRLGSEARQLAAAVGQATLARVEASLAHTRIGGGAWEQLTGRYIESTDSIDTELEREHRDIQATQFLARAGESERPKNTVEFVADRLFVAAGTERVSDLGRLVTVVSRRKARIQQLNRDITLRARMNIWLYLHVPLSIATLALLLVHVVTVFLYW